MIASIGSRGMSGWPSSVKPPERHGSAPNTRRAVSVRPDPSRPAKPTISPRRTLNETSWTLWPALRCSAVEHDVADAAVTIAERGRALGDLRDVAPQHAGDQFDLADRLHVGGLHRPPVAHDRHAIADRIEFVELVADENDGDALGLSIAG